MAQAHASDPLGASAVPSRKTLVQDLWPDKSLYAAVLLFLTGFVGVLTWIVDQVVGLSYSPRVEGFFDVVPSSLVLVLSLLAALFAGLALRTRSNRWTSVGAFAALLSVGFFGVNTLLALVSFAFLQQARREAEHREDSSRALTAEMWPDKVLAASLLLVIASLLTLLWGTAVAADLVTYGGLFGSRVVFGLLAAVFGGFGLVAARSLYLQRAPRLALLATVLVGAGVALWVVGPVLAIAAFVLIVLGLREAEFVTDEVHTAT